MPYFGGSGSGGGAAPAGQDYQIQFKLGSALGAIAELGWDPATKSLLVDRIRLRSPVTSGISATVIGESVDTDKANTVIIGRNMTANVANAVIVTNGGTPPAQQDVVIVGRPSLALAQRAVHVGRGGGASGFSAVSLGNDAQATHSRSIAIGPSSRSSAADRATFGSPAVPTDVEATRNLRALKAAIIGSEEPADTELAPGQIALWFSSTVGMVRMKAKTMENTIIRGQVVLA